MIKFLLGSAAALFLVLGACAEVSDSDIAAISIFLKKDFACAASKAMQKPVSESFLVCGGNTYDDVDAKDARNAKESYEARLLPGRYREIWVLCDVVGYGMLVRQVYVGPQDSVYWADEFQSLAHLRMHQDANQLGAARLTEFSEGEIRRMFCKAQKGKLPAGLKITQADRERHLSTMDILPRVGQSREDK